MEQVVKMTLENAARDPVIIACQEGDLEAFQLLFEKYKDRVYSIAFHYCGNKETAHDISQQVFLKLFSTIGHFRWQSEFSTWLYRLVINSCHDEQRRWKNWLLFGELAEGNNLRTTNNIEADYTHIEMSVAVREAIATLRPKLRIPVLLKYIEGLSYKEISMILNCSEGTVASRLNRGHKALAAKLEQYRNL